MRLPRLRPSRILAVAILGVFVFSGLALAGGGPSVSEVSGQFRAHVLAETPTECQGVDGLYIQDHISYRGTQVSSEARLSGRLLLTVDILVNENTGAGLFFGKLQVKSAPGVVTAQARFAGASRGPANKGIEFVNLSGGDFGLLNFSVLVDNRGRIQGEFGGAPASVPDDLAVTTNGQACTAAFSTGFQAALGG